MTDPKTIDPKDPVAVLRAAARELEIRRDDPRFVIDMDRFHLPIGATCHICLAGAVMCGLGDKVQPTRHIRTGEFGVDWSEALRALDRFRQGGVSYYLSSFGIDNSTRLKAHERFSGKWYFEGELSPQEIDALIGHCHTVADWLEDQERKKQ